MVSNFWSVWNSPQPSSKVTDTKIDKRFMHHPTLCCTNQFGLWSDELKSSFASQTSCAIVRRNLVIFCQQIRQPNGLLRHRCECASDQRRLVRRVPPPTSALESRERSYIPLLYLRDHAPPLRAQ